MTPDTLRDRTYLVLASNCAEAERKAITKGDMELKGNPGKCYASQVELIGPLDVR
jgi:hypothetical protein